MSPGHHSPILGLLLLLSVIPLLSDLSEPTTQITRQVYNLFQEPVEQPPLGFSIAEEKIDSFKNQTG